MMLQPVSLVQSYTLNYQQSTPNSNTQQGKCWTLLTLFNLPLQLEAEL